MSIQLQPPVPLVSLVKIEPPTVIKNESPESEIVATGITDILHSSESEEEIVPDLKDIDIVYHPVCEDYIKSETLESKHSRSVETQVLVKAENSPFVKTKNITQRSKTEDTSNENVTRGTGQEVVEVQEIDKQLVLNLSEDLNGISKRSRKPEHPEKTNFGKCYKTVETTSWEKEKVKVIEAPMIPVDSDEYSSLAKDKHVCNHCQHACNNLKNLQLHIKKIHREATQMYQCVNCPYMSKWSIQDHIIQEHKDTKDIQWFQCHLCEKKFKLRHNLIKHEKVHLTQERKCQICEYTTTESQLLEHHIKNTHKKRRSHKTKAEIDYQDLKYRCDKCTYKTYRHENLKAHKIIHLKPEEIRYFYCYHCSYKCPRKNQLKRHILRKHGKLEKRYCCEKCAFATENYYKFKLHQLSHKTKVEIDYRCNECDYKSHKLYSLKRHKVMHLKPEEIPYFYCYHCSYKSKQKWNLKYHIFRHLNNGEIEFDCYLCNFVTPKRESIIEHIKTHSKVQIKSEINAGS